MIIQADSLKAGLSVAGLVVLSWSMTSLEAARSQDNKTFNVNSECSAEKTNGNCWLEFDRRRPIAPPTIQMYSDAELTVVIVNPYFFERYFLDYTSGQSAVTPDVASSILQGMFSPAASIKANMAAALNGLPTTVGGGDCQNTVITGGEAPSAKLFEEDMGIFDGCASYLIRTSTKLYKRLEPYVAPDSLTAGNDTSAELSKPALVIQSDLDAIAADINQLVQYEAEFTATINAISNSKNYSKEPAFGKDIVKLTNLQKVTDALAADLSGYQQRIEALDSGEANGAASCILPGGRKSVTTNCVIISAQGDDPRDYHGMVTRTVSYSLDALNLISNSQDSVPDPSKKRAVATLTVNYADRPSLLPKLSDVALRLESSVGVFVSWLPARSYTVAPLYNGTSVTDNVVDESDVRTIVPFVAGNYRITNDLGWSRWRSNFYLTAALGVNPNTTSADIAAGLSFSWRAVMFSALCHWGHENRLTQGFYQGEHLGASFTGTLPTRLVWKRYFALGVSVRVPALTGR